MQGYVPSNVPSDSHMVDIYEGFRVTGVTYNI